MKALLLITVLFSLNANATNPRDFLTPSSEISKTQKTCVEKNPSNSGSLQCDLQALVALDQSLSIMNGIIVRDRTSSWQDRGRGYDDIKTTAELSQSSFKTYVETECDIESHPGLDKKSLSELEAEVARSACEVRLKIERLAITEKL